jgi:hypothetical protein
MGVWHLTWQIIPQLQAYTYKLQLYELLNNIIFQRRQKCSFPNKVVYDNILVTFL